MRYLLWLLGVVLLALSDGIAFANDPCWAFIDSPQEFQACQDREAAIKSDYNTRTMTDEEKRKNCAAKPATDPSCSNSYSCESLFTDSKTASECNFARCEAQRGKWSSYCQCKYIDKWIPLNTSMPFIGNCVRKTNGADPNDTAAISAFPTIISVATRMLVTVILLVSFIMIVVWWVQWAWWNAAAGKEKIKKVAIWFALLWMMWAILRLINPNFFQ